MRSTILTLLSLSRPRFWFYLAGPFLLGSIGAAPSLNFFTSFLFCYSFFWFLIPANIILYGINDISDTDTDINNPKKKDKEVHARKSTYKLYLSAISISFILLIPIFFFFKTTLALSILGLFIFLSLSYSLKPIRFKSRPFLDSLSNILYALPGLFIYSELTGVLPPFSILLSCWCWLSAMHLFSAIPDILYDKKAKVITTAVYLGREKSLLLCTFLWSISMILASLWSPLFILGSVYPLTSLCLLYASKEQLVKTYWYFPYINLVIGILLWVLLGMRFL